MVSDEVWTKTGISFVHKAVEVMRNYELLLAYSADKGNKAAQAELESRGATVEGILRKWGFVADEVGGVTERFEWE